MGNTTAKQIINNMLCLILFAILVSQLSATLVDSTLTLPVVTTEKYTVINNSLPVRHFFPRVDMSVNDGGKGDILDQYQLRNSGRAYYLCLDQWLAQGFTPTVSVLTRVELCLYEDGDPPADVVITVSIRESLTGDDLCSCEILSGHFSPNPLWVEFDFPDIMVTSESTYYLIARSDSLLLFDGFSWLIDNDNPYHRGDAYLSFDQGGSWMALDFPPEDVECDTTFKTYGLNESQMEKTFFIGKITNLTSIDIYHVFQSENIFGIQFSPLHIARYSAKEKVAVSNTFFGVLNEKYVIGFFSAHV